MHYMIQATIADLKSACLSHFDGVQWIKAWSAPGGDIYVGSYAEGQAFFHGPLGIGNPNKPWIEVQCTTPELVTRLSGVGNEMSAMKSAMRSNGLLRAAYRVEYLAGNRGLIRNATGTPVGPMPGHVIAGTSPAASYLDGEDPEDAEELADLE